MRITLFGQKRQTEINPSVHHPIFRSDRFIPPPAEAGEFSEAMLNTFKTLQEEKDDVFYGDYAHAIEQTPDYDDKLQDHDEERE